MKIKLIALLLGLVGLMLTSSCAGYTEYFNPSTHPFDSRHFEDEHGVAVRHHSGSLKDFLLSPWP